MPLKSSAAAGSGCGGGGHGVGNGGGVLMVGCPGSPAPSSSIGAADEPSSMAAHLHCGCRWSPSTSRSTVVDVDSTTGGGAVVTSLSSTCYHSPAVPSWQTGMSRRTCRPRCACKLNHVNSSFIYNLIINISSIKRIVSRRTSVPRSNGAARMQQCAVRTHKSQNSA